jgi:hypothetical protein
MVRQMQNEVITTRIRKSHPQRLRGNGLVRAGTSSMNGGAPKWMKKVGKVAKTGWNKVGKPIVKTIAPVLLDAAASALSKKLGSGLRVVKKRPAPRVKRR